MQCKENSGKVKATFNVKIAEEALYKVLVTCIKGTYVFIYLSRNVYTTYLKLKSASYKFTKINTSKQALIKSD